jgi:hypothetical protein
MAQQDTRPSNLIEAEQKTEAARAATKAAKSRKAIREALEDLEFWSNKLAMLSVMHQRGMIGGAA